MYVRMYSKFFGRPPTHTWQVLICVGPCIVALCSRYYPMRLAEPDVPIRPPPDVPPSKSLPKHVRPRLGKCVPRIDNQTPGMVKSPSEEAIPNER